jgi:hypothetical protein
MSYRRPPPDKPEDAHQGAYEVTDEEFYRDFRDVANLAGDRPIVRQVTKNTKDIGRLDVRVNVILSGLAAGVLAYAGIITKGVVG